MTFATPAWLVAGAVACAALLWMWHRYDRRQRAALAQFVAPHLRVALTHSVSPGRRRLQRILLLASVAFLFVALAGPLLGFRWEMVSRRGIQIMFAVDTSRSMSTPDVRPDRLTRAKLAIDDFTRRLDGDAVGLIAFAGDAFVVCPITLDYGAFHESLGAIDTDTIPRGGTNISMAIGEAQAALRRRAGSDKILILITDGENLEGDALVASKNAAGEDGLKIYTIGVGTTQGDLIPLGPTPNSGFLKDDDGNFVKSHLDEAALKAIAEATGGLYAPLGAEGQGFESIYQQSLAPLLKHDLISRQQRVYIQRYQWPLSGSLALLLSSLLIGSRRRFWTLRRTAPRQKSTIAALAPAALAVLLVPHSAHASPASAEELYQRGDFAAAAKEYADEAKRDPKKPALTFNLGTAQYRAGAYAEAAQAFQDSINRAPSGDAKRLADQEDAYYNLGNTLYRTGQQTEESAPQKTLENWNQAVKAYDTALAMRPGDADSKYNRDYVKRKIDELNKKQNNPQNQQNQNQNQNGQGGGQGQGQGGGQNQQPPKDQQPPKNQPPQNQPPNQGQQPPQKQPPQNQPQQNQPPNQGQNQQQPQQQPQQPPQQPPQQQNSQQPPGTGSPPPGQPPPGKGQPKPADGQPQDQRDGGGQNAEARRIPGQMSPEEARQLLDSEKGDERNALGNPAARRQAEMPPEKPAKDW